MVGAISFVCMIFVLSHQDNVEGNPFSNNDLTTYIKTEANARNFRTESKEYPRRHSLWYLPSIPSFSVSSFFRDDEVLRIKQKRIDTLEENQNEIIRLLKQIIADNSDYKKTCCAIKTSCAEEPSFAQSTSNNETPETTNGSTQEVELPSGITVDEKEEEIKEVQKNQTQTDFTASNLEGSEEVSAPVENNKAEKNEEKIGSNESSEKTENSETVEKLTDTQTDEVIVKEDKPAESGNIDTEDNVETFQPIANEKEAELGNNFEKAILTNGKNDQAAIIVFPGPTNEDEKNVEENCEHCNE